MTVQVTLKNLNEYSADQVLIEEVKDKNHFSYLDNQNCVCEIDVFEDGINILRHGEGYDLQIVGHGEKMVKVSSAEGILQLPLKIVDFIKGIDVLIDRLEITKIEIIICSFAENETTNNMVVDANNNDTLEKFFLMCINSFVCPDNLIINYHCNV